MNKQKSNYFINRVTFYFFIQNPYLTQFFSKLLNENGDTLRASPINCYIHL